MFTGIVERMGRVRSFDRVPFGARLAVEPGLERPASEARDRPPTPGDSIAVNGCCLTVAALIDDAWCFDVIRQTLEVTTLGSLQVGDRVNLETSATPTTLLGGHLVQGHVDGVGEVVEVDADAQAWRLRIAAPEAVRTLLIDKGSITIDGVSLTIADLEQVGQVGEGEPSRPTGPSESIGQSAQNRPRPHRSPRWFEVALIPTTLAKTTLAERVVGDRVNLESDSLVRMVAALLPRLR